MKRTFIIGLFLAVILCGVVWMAYSIGYRRGVDFMLFLDQEREFAFTLDQLDKIRAGDVEAGTRSLELFCFSAANNVYNGRPENRIAADALFDDLRHYRQTYRTNSAEWSSTERDLEKKLAGWKKK